MTNLYPKLFDYNNIDELYYDKIIEVLLLLKRKRLELNVNKKSKDYILIKDIELEKAIDCRYYNESKWGFPFT